jgi:hypothetical protein
VTLPHNQPCADLRQAAGVVRGTSVFHLSQAGIGQTADVSAEMGCAEQFLQRHAHYMG